MAETTIINSAKVSEMIQQLKSVQQKNTEIFVSLDKLINVNLENVWKGGAAGAYKSQYANLKKTLIQTFEALLGVYQSTLGNASNDMMLDDQKIAQQFSDSLGVQ